MVEDPKWELAILATVQGFYERLLQESIGGEVPVPQGLEAISLQQDEGDVHQTLDKMRRWLRLLDLAITPAMLRRAFTPDTDAEIAEAMLRYFVRKRDVSAVTRDKTDLVATFLYRHPRVPGQWEQRGYGLDGALPLAPFEIALIEILADADVPLLPEEHVQLLRRFDPLEEEAEKLRDFNTLMEAGIITRVRDLKQYLDSSFYHPSVLATIAPYNATFGKKFDELFGAAAAEISNFAQALAEQGGNILGNVDGFDVTVEHIEALDRDALLKSDYATALEKFQRVSKLKKTLDRRPPIRRTGKPAQPVVVMPVRSAGGAAAAAKPALAKPRTPRVVATAATPQQLTMEETKLQRVEESVRVFVRVADPKFRQVVPMRFFNLMLSPAEADAFCADYLDEKSARADVARNLLRIVATIARMSTEIEELKRSHNSPSLWKLHADSLVVLLEVARRTAENASQTLAEIDDSESAATLQASLHKLRERTELVVRVLAHAQSENDAS